MHLENGSWKCTGDMMNKVKRC